MNSWCLRFARTFAWVAAVMIIDGARGATPLHPIVEGLVRGAIGGIYIDQMQSDIEGLLHRALPVAAFSHNTVAASVLEPNDLRLLGIADVGGAGSLGVYLWLDDPPRGDRRIIAISISMACEDIAPLREKLRYDDAVAQLSTPESVAGESDEGRIYWGIDAHPTCLVRMSKRISSP